MCMITRTTQITAQEPEKNVNYGVQEFNVIDVENIKMKRLFELTNELNNYIGKTAVFHIPGTKPDTLWGTIDCTDDREEKVVISEIHVYSYGIEIESENGEEYRIEWLTKLLDNNVKKIKTDGIVW